MFELSQEKVKSWFSVLPEDVQDAIKEVIPEDTDEISKFVQKLNELEVNDWAQHITSNVPLLEEMGRVRRIKLLSHVAGKTYPFNIKVYQQIVDDEGDNEGAGTTSGGTKSTKVLFIEDIRALNEALAVRVAKNNMDAVALDALKAAAFEVEPQVGMI